MNKKFNPNAATTEDSGIFGLPYNKNESKVVYLPVPWEATTSYGGGTSQGPSAIFEASKQLDLFDIELGNFYEQGIYMLDIDTKIESWNKTAKSHAQNIIKHGGITEANEHELISDLNLVNQYSEQVNQWVYESTLSLLSDKKIVGLIGGDHSTPFGAIKALAELHSEFGILHFDAHSDTRNAFEGFRHSHASIMHNVLSNIPQVKKCVQVGIRDFCEEEYNFIKSQNNRMEVFYDQKIKNQKNNGISWDKISKDIVNTLPNLVYISFDIDGLDPRFCPNTGTPVPGGLELSEALHLIREVTLSGRKIIGFDLNEVSPDPENQNEWDANVGMRLLYKMTGYALASQGLAKLNH